MGASTLAKSIRTMEEFSEFVGLSRPTVSKYFNDPASVRKKTRDAIEDALKAEIPSVRLVIHVEPDDEAKLPRGTTAVPFA